MSRGAAVGWRLRTIIGNIMDPYCPYKVGHGKEFTKATTSAGAPPFTTMLVLWTMFVAPVALVQEPSHRARPHIALVVGDDLPWELWPTEEASHATLLPRITQHLVREWPLAAPALRVFALGGHKPAGPTAVRCCSKNSFIHSLQRWNGFSFPRDPAHPFQSHVFCYGDRISRVWRHSVWHPHVWIIKGGIVIKNRGSQSLTPSHHMY